MLSLGNHSLWKPSFKVHLKSITKPQTKSQQLLPNSFSVSCIFFSVSKYNVFFILKTSEFFVVSTFAELGPTQQWGTEPRIPHTQKSCATILSHHLALFLFNILFIAFSNIKVIYFTLLLLKLSPSLQAVKECPTCQMWFLLLFTVGGRVLSGPWRERSEGRGEHSRALLGASGSCHLWTDWQKGTVPATDSGSSKISLPVFSDPAWWEASWMS